MAGLYDYASILGSGTKRKVFYSFHYDDVMRVNVVRKAWEFVDPGKTEALGFYDSSLWESKKLTGPDAVKDLIRDGVQGTSAVCVLIGSQTFTRRWVRYEIARAVIDGRGLLAVHLNSIRHHTTRTAHEHGYNPFAMLAITKVQDGALSIPTYRLVENNYYVVNGVGTYKWEWYKDYTHAVDKPKWLADPAPGTSVRLDSGGTPTYDYIANDGHHQIGTWINNAARAAGY